MVDRDICDLIKTADIYPQKISAAIARAVQLEWIFLQRVKNYTGQAFTGLEKVLR